MNVLRLLFLLFVLVPLVEIYILIQAAGAIGIGWTIVLVVLTAVIGAALVRRQGFSTLMRARADLGRGETPTLALVEGVCLLMAGALLLTPGFVSDAVGFALLTPPLRRAMLMYVIRRHITLSASVVSSSSSSVSSPASRPPLEGQYRRDD